MGRAAMTKPASAPQADCRGVLDYDGNGDLACPKCGFKPGDAPKRQPHKPAAEPVPVAQGDGSVLAFVRVMRNLRERYPADADVVEAYSNILQAAIIKQAEARTALEASLAACRAESFADRVLSEFHDRTAEIGEVWPPEAHRQRRVGAMHKAISAAIDALRQEAPHAE